MQPRNKRIGFALGLLLTVALVWVVWSFIAGTDQIQNFCNSLSVGEPVAQIQLLSAQHGYRVTPLIDGQLFIYDTGSFGRYTCNVQFGSDGLLVSSEYTFND